MVPMLATRMPRRLAIGTSPAVAALPPRPPIQPPHLSTEASLVIVVGLYVITRGLGVIGA